MSSGKGKMLQIAALLCMVTPLLAQIASMRYDFSPDWHVIVSSAHLTTVRIANSLDFGNHYFILNNGSHDIVSPNGIFTLGMYPTSIYYGLYLIMQNKLDKGVAAVALLQRYRDVGSELNYADIFWKSVELYDNGTLRFADKEDQVRENAAFLLPGARLESGMSLYNNEEPSRWHHLEVTVGGLIMRTNDMLYYVLSLNTGGEATEDIARTSKCKGFEAVLHYNGTHLYLSYEPTTSTGLSSERSCTVPTLWIHKSDAKNLSLPYLRLERDGNLESYGYNQQHSNWVQDFKFTNYIPGSSFCKLPYTCNDGHYCDAKDGNCILVLEVLEYECPDQVCNVTLNITVSGVSFYSLRFLNASMTGNLEDCTKKCSEDCHCRALFYNYGTEGCFFVDVDSCSIASQMYKDDATQNITAYIKGVKRQYIYTVPDRFLFMNLRIILLGLAPMFLFLVAICCLVIVKHKKSKSSPEKEIKLMLATMPGLPQRYSYTALDTATKGFSTRLGTGGFGSVYEGFTADGRHVAVKKLDHCTDTAGSRQFVTELAGTGGISHLNIVKLYGFCIEGATRRLLIYEFMPNGSLDRWLFGSDRSLSWKKRVSIALGTARGLAYLHEECSEPILHLDVKPQNILLDENFVVKVADFGMAKLLSSQDVTQVQTGVKGTPGYLAPEWLLRNVATKKCDVYSYGMVLLELIGGRRNIDLTKVNDEEVDPSWYFPAWAVNEIKLGNLLGVVDEKVRADGSSDSELYRQMVKMIFLALWCIQDNPSARPSMHAIVDILEDHAQVDEPPYLFHFEVQTQTIVNSTTPKAPSCSTLEIFELEEDNSLLR